VQLVALDLASIDDDRIPHWRVHTGGVIVALDAATVWADVAIPLLLGFLGGGIAIFWPWLQSFFRRRKFQGIIRRELAEIGPEPPSPLDGKPWWEDLTKRFVHEEAFARERFSENRDFLLSLDPAVVYLVSQLWIAFAKRDGKQWLDLAGELATDGRVGTERLRAAEARRGADSLVLFGRRTTAVGRCTQRIPGGPKPPRAGAADRAGAHRCTQRSSR
jgi:hypothetical protein